MATTTATITLASTDLLSDELALTSSATLTAAGNSTGIANTSGLSRKTTANTNEYTLFAAADYTDDKAHKLYLKNISTTAAEYFIVEVAGTVVGRIYAGDWALIPWAADTTGTNCDIDITPSASDMTLEYMLFVD
jgi:hypothetical protein|tara:strand:+ start:895 stop:1299 length:405 start_codon:yes stop_codon:yes gene_type:complete